MPRSRTNNFSEFPYHITCRTINRDWFAMPLDQVWKVMEDYLFYISVFHKIRIHAFVLMSNHFHMLASAPEKNLSVAMGEFMRYTSLEITKSSDRINHLWAHRFKRCEIQSEHYLKNAYKYVYYNPVKAGICSKAEDYRFSTLSRLMGKWPLPFPVVDDPFIFDAYLGEFLWWLNRPPELENWTVMQRCLKKSVFKIARANGQKHHLEFDAL